MKKFNDTLVLNKAWIPVHIVVWKKAMSLIYQEHANALDRDFLSYPFKYWLEFSRVNGHDYAVAHSARLAIAIPEIVVLTKYNKLPPRDVKYSRENVFQRDKYKCQYCGNVFTLSNLTVDHIIPRDAGGKSVWHNITTACKTCNNFKANRTPAQAHMTLLKKPVKPQWLNPITHARGKTHICESWKRFMDRVEDKVDEQDGQNRN